MKKPLTILAIFLSLSSTFYSRNTNGAALAQSLPVPAPKPIPSAPNPNSSTPNINRKCPPWYCSVIVIVDSESRSGEKPVHLISPESHSILATQITIHEEGGRPAALPTSAMRGSRITWVRNGEDKNEWIIYLNEDICREGTAIVAKSGEDGHCTLKKHAPAGHYSYAITIGGKNEASSAFVVASTRPSSTASAAQ